MLGGQIGPPRGGEAAAGGGEAEAGFVVVATEVGLAPGTHAVGDGHSGGHEAAERREIGRCQAPVGVSAASGRGEVLGVSGGV